MRITIVIPSFYPAVVYGGPIFSTLNTCKAIAQKEHKLQVLTTNTNMYDRLKVPMNEWVDLEGFKVKYFNETKVGVFSLGLLFGMWRHIKKTEIVHIQAIFNTPTPMALLAATWYRKPIILSPRGVLGSWVMGQGSRFKKLWLRFLIRPFINKIVWHATAQQEKEEILFHFPSATIEIIPNGIDLQAFSGKPWLSKKEYLLKYLGIEFSNDVSIITSLGRLHEKKGFNFLIDSMLEMDASVILLIGGQDEGELIKLKKQVVDHKLENSVFFVGEISAEQKKEFLIHSDVFALTSHNENFGNVYAEALACGIPVVASKYTPWEEVEEYECGRWVDLDQKQIVSALKDLLTDTSNKSDHARLFIRQYAWEGIGAKFIALYKRLL